MRRMKFLYVLVLVGIMSFVLFKISYAVDLQTGQKQITPTKKQAPKVLEETTKPLELPRTLWVGNETLRVGTSHEYLVTCKGGTTNKSYMMLHGDDALSFLFRKASHGSTEGELAPGECAWLDRGLLNSEVTDSKLVIYMRNMKDQIKQIRSVESTPVLRKVIFNDGLVKDWFDRVDNETKFHAYVYISENNKFLIFNRMGP